MARPIYLDYNGTTPHDPEVIDAMLPFLKAEFGNPSSNHWYGIAPKRAVEQARGQVASLLNCEACEIVFTSGGTESNNHAIQGAAFSLRGKGSHIITSSIEHPAVLQVCHALEKSGFQITLLGVDSQGLIDLDELKSTVRDDTILVTIMHSNNEVGTLQPIEGIARFATARGIAVHSDAAQSVGKMPMDVRALGVDLLSVAGHKLYAPKGVGALYIRQGFAVEKFCYGAGQEKGFRAGTENVLEIVGLGKACEIAGRNIEKSGQHLLHLRDHLHTGISRELGGMVRLNGHPSKRLPNTVSLSFKGLEANRILEEIGLDVAASPGAACHSDVVEVSHVLQVMDVPLEWAMGTVRFTVGRMTTLEEIDRAISVVVAAVRKLMAEK